MLSTKKIIIVGATGRVGREMLSILSKENIPTENVACAASERSEGTKILYKDVEIIVQNIQTVDFARYDLALFSAGSEVSKIYVQKASDNNCIAIDNTSYFRMREDISLIVPEVNMDDYNKFENKYIIANPNCSTIQMVMPLKPLNDIFGLKDVVASTYQAVSGAGQKGVDELLLQTKNPFDTLPHHFKKQIAFNVIPQIDMFTESLYTKEEEKMMQETRKILNLPNITITATCVRVPVITGHSVSVVASFEKEVDIQIARDAMSNFDGITLVDDPSSFSYTTPIESAGRNDVYVSRVRRHPDFNNKLSFWCVADNLRKGAALNSIQIARNILI